MIDKMICIIGASGSGKTSVANILDKKYGLKQLRSYSTRKPRYDGDQEHTYISVCEFESLQNMIASTVFNDHLYGATKEQYDSSDIYVIDPVGFYNMLQIFVENQWEYKQPFVVWLDTDVITRMIRMENRGDNAEQIQERVEHDARMFNDIVMMTFLKNKWFPVMHISSDLYSAEQIADMIYKDYTNDLVVIDEVIVQLKDDNEMSLINYNIRDKMKGEKPIES